MERKYETKEILEALIKREGVQHIEIKPYENILIKINNVEQDLDVKQGPARIALIYD